MKKQIRILILIAEQVLLLSINIKITVRLL